MEKVECIRNLKREEEFFNLGYPVFLAPHKLPEEAKKLQLKKRGVRRPCGTLILANSEEVLLFLKKYGYKQITKEEHLAPKYKARNEKTQKKVNNRHGLGRYTDEELQNNTLKISTTTGNTFENNAYKQKLWMKKIKQENYNHKTLSEKEFLNSFTKNQIAKHIRVQHEIIVDGHTFFLDYYLKRLKVCIEIDGGYHFTPEQRAKDKERDNILAQKDIKVLRIKNENARIENAKLFCEHPFVVSEEKYELYIFAGKYGGTYCIMYHGEIISTNKFINTKKGTNGNLVLIKEGIKEIHKNSIVIVKGRMDKNLHTIFKNRSSIIKQLSTELYYLDYVPISTKKDEAIIEHLKYDYNKNMSIKRNTISHDNNTNNKSRSKTKDTVNRSILKVYVNASSLESNDKKTKATGVSYSIVDSQGLSRNSTACVDGQKYSCHLAILLAISRLVKQHIPENTHLQIFVTNSNLKYFDKNNQSNTPQVLEFINIFDTTCYEKRISTELCVITNPNNELIMQINKKARDVAERGLATHSFFEI